MGQKKLLLTTFALLVISAVICIALYYVLTGRGEQMSVGWVLTVISPYMFCVLGISSVVSLSICGAAFGIYTSGASITSGGVRMPRIIAKNFISVIFCEAVAVYGLILAIVLAGSLEQFDDEVIKNNREIYERNWLSGYVVLAAGIITGCVNFFCGVTVGTIGSAVALADAADKTLFGRILIIEILASADGLFGLIVGVYVTSKIRMGN